MRIGEQPDWYLVMRVGLQIDEKSAQFDTLACDSGGNYTGGVHGGNGDVYLVAV